MIIKKIRKFCRSGNGELLGFVVCMPMFVWLLMFMVSIAQLAITKEQITYLTYAAGRAAVVSENATDAINNAQAVVDESSDLSGFSNVTVDILFNGNPITDTNADTISWQKGEYIVVRLNYTTDALISGMIPFSDDELDMNGSREMFMVMMVERPVPNDPYTNEWANLS